MATQTTDNELGNVHAAIGPLNIVADFADNHQKVAEPNGNAVATTDILDRQEAAAEGGSIENIAENSFNIGASGSGFAGKEANERHFALEPTVIVLSTPVSAPDSDCSDDSNASTFGFRCENEIGETSNNSTTAAGRNSVCGLEEHSREDSLIEMDLAASFTLSVSVKEEEPNYEVELLETSSVIQISDDSDIED